MAPRIAGEARETLDAAGQLVSPPFVDAHFHMDATLSYGLPRINQSGTLLEGIALWGELKPQLTFEAIVERALTYCDWAVAKGLLAIRSHVDVCDPRLLAVEALLEVKKRVAPYLDLQLVAFPQDGVLRSPGALANLERALDLGVEVVGGIPHFERTMADGAESVKLLCELAARRGLRVDMHCDETDDPMSRHIETLAYHTQRLGLQGRVNGSHLTSMHSMDNYYVSKLIPADGRGAGERGRQPADQHHHPGPARHLSQAPRHDPRSRAARCRHPGGVRPRLRDGSLVQPGLGRHAGSRAHGPARGADDRPGRDARLLPRRHGDAGRHSRSRRLRRRARLPRRFRVAAGARPGRSDPAARNAARGNPAREGDRTQSGEYCKPAATWTTGLDQFSALRRRPRAVWLREVYAIGSDRHLPILRGNAYV